MFSIGSILLSFAVVEIIMAVVLVTFWRMRLNARGLKEMAGAMAIGSLGALLTAVGTTQTNLYFGFAGIACFVIGILSAARSMRRLQGMRPLYSLEVPVFFLCMGSDAYFLLVAGNVAGAVTTNSLAYTLVCGLTAWNLMSEKRLALRPGCRVLGYMFAAFAVANFLRAGIRPFFDVPTQIGGQIVSLDLIFVFIGFVISISWSLGFLWASYSGSEFELRTANEKLVRFSGAVAHDLKTPLNGIIGYLEAVDHLPATAGPEQKEYFIASARDAALQMNTFINDLLEHSRLVQLNPNLEVADIEVCVTDAMRQLSSKIESANADIRIGDLHVVATNAFQMTRLLQNLMDNALKYRSEERLLCIDISSTRIAGWAYLSVKDNGVGISESNLAKIFRRFERAEDETVVPGYGLGLSECRLIAENAGGTIDVTSKLGHGTTFIVKLPAVRV